MYFLNKDTGWVAKDLNYMLKTSDGGDSWKNYGNNNLSSQLGQSIEQIQFIHNNIGYAVGGYIKTLDQAGSPVKKGIVLKTVDGGLSWNIIFDSNNIHPGNFYSEYFRSLSFLDENNGYVAGQQIYKTTDGGITWQSVPGIYSNKIHFVNNNCI